MKSFIYSLLIVSLLWSCSSDTPKEVQLKETIGIDFKQYVNFDSLKTLAQEQGKPVFIDCYASWCGPCKMMTNNVFPDTTVGQYFNAHYVSYKIDMEKEGTGIAKKFNISAYPTYLFLDGNGNEMHRAIGYINELDFINLAAMAKDNDQNLAGFKKRFKDGQRDLEFLKAYADVLYEANLDFNNPVQAYLDQLEESDYGSEATYEFFLSFLNDVEAKETQHLLANRSKYEKMFGSFELGMLLERIGEAHFYRIYKNLDPKELKVLTSYLRNNDLEQGPLLAFEFEMKFAKRRKDWTTYEQLALENVDTYWSDNANELNAVAWYFYENIENYESIVKAIEWAKKAVQENESYGYLDTYAAILFKAGRFDQAQYAAQKAIEIGTENGDNTKPTEDLLQKIKQKLS